jgi:hypothetical protein
MPRCFLLQTPLIPAAAFCVVISGCTWLDDRPLPPKGQSYTASARALSPVFTPGAATVGQAVRDFFGVRHEARQPMDFPHDVHVANGLTCTSSCHIGGTRSPVAGLPSVRTCMSCHRKIAADRPPIQQMAAMAKQGRDFEWQRVYGYPAQSHVRFNHAPHIRAKVECATCHGDIARQTVAQRTVDLTMGFCVTCHREHNASNDCLTCHY